MVRRMPAKAFYQEVEELKEAQWGAQLEPERHSVCKETWLNHYYQDYDLVSSNPEK